MKILYLAHRIPFPPDKGDKIRAFRQLQRLADRHRVWCACFVDKPSDFRHVAALREYCEDVRAVEVRPTLAKFRGLWRLLRGDTITEGYYRSGEMRDALRRWSSKIRFDAVVAFSSGMASYALDVPAPRRVLDLCDRDSGKWLDIAGHRRGLARRILRAEGERLAARELRWIDGSDATILITEEEAAPLRDLVAARKLHVVGNGVALPPLREAGPATPPVVGFVGVMDYFPNVDAVTWFARDGWPMVRSVQPRAVFRIVGRNPTRAVRRLARIPGVQVVGEVEDVGAELSRFDVSVAPLRIARGIQNKVLEAMAAGRPVVLTARAAAGINAVPNRDYLVADTAPTLAGAVRDLLGDPELRAEIGTSARRFVAERARWEPELVRFEAIVTRIVTRSEPRTSVRAAPPPPLCDPLVRINVPPELRLAPKGSAQTSVEEEVQR